MAEKAFESDIFPQIQKPENSRAKGKEQRAKSEGRKQKAESRRPYPLPLTAFCLLPTAYCLYLTLTRVVLAHLLDVLVVLAASDESGGQHGGKVSQVTVW